jgi:hypothetical protein
LTFNIFKSAVRRFLNGLEVRVCCMVMSLALGDMQKDKFNEIICQNNNQTEILAVGFE